MPSTGGETCSEPARFASRSPARQRQNDGPALALAQLKSGLPVLHPLEEIGILKFAFLEKRHRDCPIALLRKARELEAAFRVRSRRLHEARRVLPLRLIVRKDDDARLSSAVQRN